MPPHITEKTISQFVKDVGDQHYILTGTVIATSAAQAAALGEACMQISLDNQVDTLNWQDVTARIEQMVQIKTSLIESANREALVMAEYNSRTTDKGQAEDVQKNFKTSEEVTRLCLEAMQLLQDFRPLVLTQLKGSLQIVLKLLASEAETMLLWLSDSLAQADQLVGADIAGYELRLAELKQELAKVSAENYI